MEKIKYPVYDYIKFIWKKKLLLIGFTILCMVIGAGFSYTKETVYTSTALVFTGNGNNEKLSKPGLIKDTYKDALPEDISSSLDVKITEPYQITLSLSGSDKVSVESNTKKVAEQYTSDLTERFNEQYDVQENIKDALEGVVKNTKEAISQYNKLIQETSDEAKLLHYNEVLINKMEAFDKYQADLEEVEYDLVLAEDPELMNVTTTQTSNNLLRNTILAGAFGFQLMLVLLVLWKYIINARRALSERK
ncbi:Wzz/FepE/Etk N-terminal domain-containing protein [Cytobacillus firmus]|uniref:Wzz/FepE/Etk N-terminal domain-containing protein n=1 Tax=Cytobacillus firmus TaxID=1399 RepID=UPI0024C1F42A|nr:Wzz/FepE/Etk N-terminal domain-containing protein [Cytobacillus firmus]WHY61465.1 Wzz/FepE/Etk N-terminal domain-containing protein [Cytobacillus firmus]